MPKTLKPAKRQLVLMLIDDFENAPDIAKHIKCSERTVYNYKANMKLYGQPGPISVSRMGPAKKMTEENIEIYVLYSQIQRR
jgi:transposase